MVLLIQTNTVLTKLEIDGPLYILYLGWEVKNDVSDQSKDALKLCNVNIRKSLLGQKWGTVCDFFG